MRSQSHGLMATLLMFVPLLAVPFIAGLGVPWLIQQAKSDVASPPEPALDSLMESGVGESQSGRKTPDDLFAPVVYQPVLKLHESSGQPAAAVQNPHLRNASLVVPSHKPWVDPFDGIASQPPIAKENSSPNSLNQWPVKESPAKSFPQEAPLPKDFSTPTEEVAPQEASNPFAEGNQNSTPAVSPKGLEVAINDNAFADPGFDPQVNHDPNQFDASRTLFVGEKTPPENPPPAPRQTAEVELPEPPPMVTPPPNVMPAPLPNQPKALSQPTPLTWEKARARLQELGIQQYYLDPDPAEQRFLFRCAYTPAGNPRVHRRFEAEAADPLEAVQKVLSQVESWTARQ